MQTSTPVEYPANRTRLLNILSVITGLAIAATFILGLFYAGTDVEQGNVQRIFYMHIGGFSGGSTAFFITVVAGVMYLIKRDPKWDRLAVSSVEIGLPLMLVTLVTGMIWARPIWNTWWTGDPRLNSMAIMMLMYAAYLTLRAAIESPEQRARFAAVYGIVSFISVIYVFMVIRIRPDTLHPVVLGPSPVESTAKGSFGVKDPAMIITMSVSSVAWMLTAITLTWYRLRMENVAEKIRARKMQLLGQ
jgi:heme exporter protein C